MKPSALTAIRQNSFSHRVVNSWNESPEDVLAESLNQFKIKIKLEYFWKHKAFKNDIYIHMMT